MRGDAIKLLHYEATVKPDVKKLIDNLADMTDWDITNAVVPLPWYRDALRKMKAQIDHATMLASMDQSIIDSQVSDPMGWIAWWDADDTLIRLDRGELEIKFNTAIWFPDTGGVWIETIFSQKIDPKLSVLRQTQYMAKSQYYIEYRKRINALSPTSTIDLTGGAVDKPRFTIQRH